MKLALGTAQIGLNYGVANTDGRPSLHRARGMVERARQLGFDTIDTAINYGDSESRLGKIGVSEWNIVSKLPPVPPQVEDVAKWINGQVTSSLKRLGVERLSGMLLHRALDLKSHSGCALYAALSDLRSRGLVERIGVSVYGPDELDALCNDFQFDLVQAPCNILDRRLMQSGWLKKLEQRGTEVHIRSVFLQGLLLMGVADRPPAFTRWQSLWTIWDHWLQDTNTTPIAACLRYAMSVPGVSRLVVGADSTEQLTEMVVACDGPPQSLPAGLACDDVDLIVPSNWPKFTRYKSFKT